MFGNTDTSTFLKSAEKAEKLLKLIANKHRLMILCSLVDGEKSVSELESLSDISQSAISQHLAKLREANIIDFRKDGVSVFYQLSSPETTALLSILYLIYCK